MRIKKLKIETERDLKSFYKKLFLYKSFLFRNTFFELNSDPLQINSVLMALNIKNRKKKINYIYDSACYFIDTSYKNLDVCGFKNGKCYVQQKLKKDLINGCCRGCLYQSCNGCQTANLTCKFFFCSEVEKRIKVIRREEVPVLRCFSIRQRTLLKYNYFSSREDILMDLYIGSLFIGSIRILYRQVRNFIQRKTN